MRWIGLGFVVLGPLIAGGCSRPSLAVARVEAQAGEEEPVLKSRAANEQESGKPPDGTGEFRFPNDQGGWLVAQLLTPSDKGRGSPPFESPGPRQLATPPAIEQPALPLPPSQAPPLRLPAQGSRQVRRPDPVPEAMPLAGIYIDPRPPQVSVLPAGQRARVPSPDVNQPTPLPRLAQQVPDRASLEDPTAAASMSAALAAPPPARSGPAPFLRLSRPDPFENQQPVSGISALAEEPLPINLQPARPAK